MAVLTLWVCPSPLVPNICSVSDVNVDPKVVPVLLLLLVIRIAAGSLLTPLSRKAVVKPAPKVPKIPSLGSSLRNRRVVESLVGMINLL